MNGRGSVLWFDRSLLAALVLTAAMYVVTVLVGGVQGEYLGQPAVLAVVLGALLARWRRGLGWLLAIIGMLSTATLLYVLAASTLYPDGMVSVDHPAGDLSRMGDFRPVFLLHLVALLLATGVATILTVKVTRHRFIWAVGLGLMLATSITGAVTLATGDWITYETIMTLPFWPWVFGSPVVLLLAIATVVWAVGLAMRVRAEAGRAPRDHQAGAVRDALLRELVPAFAGAQRTGAAAERAWFATELHAAVLPAIRSAVQSATPSGSDQADVRKRLTELEAELRRIADGKRSVLLEEFGLVHALEGLVERVQHEHGIPIDLQVAGDVDLGRPPLSVEQAAFDICRLALDNAVTHAGAEGIHVFVDSAAGHVHVDVSDDGHGLDAGAVESARRTGRHGVQDMHQAARSVSGRLVVEPANTSGTRVSFEWGRA
ncbi:MAG: two-component system, NarL family, sensor histidine kinase UhpB [Chloroflexota bacterium]|nr:two-component system, NarL family, sensor histidine kinase UhpB [Chloroflexota bacterium]